MVQQIDKVRQEEWVTSEARLGRARFIAQGTDVNDVEQTLGRISRAEDWCREWSATGEMHEELAKEAVKLGRTISAGEAYIMAALAYHWGKMRWKLVLEDEAQYHRAHQKSIETFWKGLQYLDPTAERVEIPYEGITMPAHLRKPKGVSRAPVVLLLAGGLGKGGIFPLVQRVSEAGYGHPGSRRPWSRGNQGQHVGTLRLRESGIRDDRLPGEEE
jgi:hypothetical protein